MKRNCFVSVRRVQGCWLHRVTIVKLQFKKLFHIYLIFLFLSSILRWKCKAMHWWIKMKDKRA